MGPRETDPYRTMQARNRSIAPAVVIDIDQFDVDLRSLWVRLSHRAGLDRARKDRHPRAMDDNSGQRAPMIDRARSVAAGFADVGLTQAEELLRRLSPEGRGQARREREVALKRNGFWLDYLHQAYRYGDALALQANTAGMEALTPVLVEALVGLLNPRLIVARNDSADAPGSRPLASPCGTIPPYQDGSARTSK